jgi:hypothetical protein
MNPDTVSVINAIELSVPVNSSGNPTAPGEQPTGWRIRMDTGNSSGGRTFDVYLHCVTP